VPERPSVVEASAAGDSTRLEIRTASGARYTLHVARDSTVAPQAEARRTDVVGEIPNVSVVIVDTYPSRSGGMSYCQAGEERFLRVVTLAGNRASEAARVKVASCRDNIELAERGIEWVTDSATVRIHWLAAESAGPLATRTIRLGPDGRPTS
jgi:hypothetical protein